jgi:hypothetical protein
MRMANRCSQCSSYMWCDKPGCIGAKAMTPEERRRAGLPPLAQATPVTNSPAKPITNSITNAPKPKRITNAITNSVDPVTRSLAWRTSNPERYRTYMREYMRTYRAGKKKPAAT